MWEASVTVRSEASRGVYPTAGVNSSGVRRDMSDISAFYIILCEMR